MTDSPAASAEVLAHQVDAEGDEPLLLLNGGMMSFAAWEPVAAPLRAVRAEGGGQRYRLIGCDFRGQLRSPGAAHEQLAAHAEDVAALLHHLDLGPVHVVGASFGGLVGVELAAAHPELVHSLVVATAAIRADEAMDASTDRMIALIRIGLAGGDLGFVHDLMADQFFSAAWREEHAADLAARRTQVAALPRWWFEGLLGILAAVRSYDVSVAASRVRCPALVVVAGGDEVMKPDSCRELAAALRAEAVEHPTAGHALIVEDPSWMAQAFVDLLQRALSLREPSC
ncbi:MAG TPA: alpha/beta hydrolase [Thermoanaerobaculia bacterium]|nr:alpha/beta hydrolase [Thermoanaerobaculia bacterium]